MKVGIKILLGSALAAILFASCGRSGLSGTVSNSGLSGIFGKTESDGPSEKFPTLFLTVPSDAMGLVYCGRTSAVLSYIDSTNSLCRLPLGSLSDRPAMLSLCYNTAPVQSLAIDAGRAGSDTTYSELRLLRAADSLGFHSVMRSVSSGKKNKRVIVVCKSENVFKTVCRHLDSGASIADAPFFSEAYESVGKADDIIMLRHDDAAHLIPQGFLSEFIPAQRLSAFVKSLADWTVIIPNGGADFRIKEISSGSKSHFANIIDRLPSGSVKLPYCIPEKCDFAITLSIASIKEFRQEYEQFLDANLSLSAYGDTLKACSKRSGKNPLDWEKEIEVKEVSMVCWEGRSVLLYRPSKKCEPAAAAKNPYVNFIPSLYGGIFNLDKRRGRVSGGDYVGSDGIWMVLGNEDDVNEFMATEKIVHQEYVVSKCSSLVWTPAWTLSTTPRDIIFRIKN